MQEPCACRIATWCFFFFLVGAVSPQLEQPEASGRLQQRGETPRRALGLARQPRGPESGNAALAGGVAALIGRRRASAVGCSPRPTALTRPSTLARRARQQRSPKPQLQPRKGSVSHPAAVLAATTRPASYMTSPGRFMSCARAVAAERPWESAPASEWASAPPPPATLSRTHLPVHRGTSPRLQSNVCIHRAARALPTSERPCHATADIVVLWIVPSYLSHPHLPTARPCLPLLSPCPRLTAGARRSRPR